jgi:hypothetical protein
MKKLLLILFVLIVSPAGQVSNVYSVPSQKARFFPLNIYIDSSSETLAAYQFELYSTSPQIKIVGVEGGDSTAFKEPPYYDPAALANNRIIIAAFNNGDNLPKGKTKVATIHLQATGDIEPAFEISLTLAATKGGQKINAEISFEKGEQK